MYIYICIYVIYIYIHFFKYIHRYIHRLDIHVWITTWNITTVLYDVSQMFFSHGTSMKNSRAWDPWLSVGWYKTSSPNKDINIIIIWGDVILYVILLYIYISIIYPKYHYCNYMIGYDHFLGVHDHCLRRYKKPSKS